MRIATSRSTPLRLSFPWVLGDRSLQAYQCLWPPLHTASHETPNHPPVSLLFLCFSHQLLGRTTWSTPIVRSELFKQAGGLAVQAQALQTVAAAMAVSPAAPESLALNPGQPWTLTALASYLSVLTGGHCVDGKHTQACTWELPRILPCGGWSWPEAPIRLLRTAEATVPATPGHTPRGSMRVQTRPSAQSTRNRQRTTSLLFVSCLHQSLHLFLSSLNNEK